MKKWLLWSCLWLLTVCVIFIFSNQPGDVSSQSSGWVMKQLVAILQFFVPTIEASTQLEGTIRVAAHASIYTVLGAMSALVVYQYNQWQQKGITVLKNVGISWLLSLLVSLADEYNQLSVTGRDGSWSDVLVDMIGVTLAVVIITVLLSHRLYRKN
ncbi:VanZ family protein [Tuanshanicoccus lijuaniae]|uniref:VanZ family protein n=1 Tax=Aerococcaceae bacterium zg-1292 TaxID=2774330 RepID=UPI001937D7AA|nr:VanZ family protein [Aerococcaceae bacterium zg-1292]MBF6625852.1 VanZ family protein [Aerococcaceae bacterium zg-BR9]MBF6978587.1 VanZ family protein [Aerococcaceae bacterium zg-BR22]MBS4455572.1 VanZ family protein [Aerococcaceae bacterium zg-A91]MBS4457191.1 VanZ family protein [Aerococcaceae bacterium zg-BR33]